MSLTHPKDCDDTDSAINPDALEVVGDTIDQDCDGYDGLGIRLRVPAFPTTKWVDTGFVSRTGDTVTVGGGGLGLSGSTTGSFPKPADHGRLRLVVDVESKSGGAACSVTLNATGRAGVPMSDSLSVTSFGTLVSAPLAVDQAPHVIQAITLACPAGSSMTVDWLTVQNAEDVFPPSSEQADLSAWEVLEAGGVLYALTGQVFSGTGWRALAGGLWTSLDYGENWDRVADTHVAGAGLTGEPDYGVGGWGRHSGCSTVSEEAKAYGGGKLLETEPTNDALVYIANGDFDHLGVGLWDGANACALPVTGTALPAAAESGYVRALARIDSDPSGVPTLLVGYLGNSGFAGLYLCELPVTDGVVDLTCGGATAAVCEPVSDAFSVDVRDVEVDPGGPGRAGGGRRARVGRDGRLHGRRRGHLDASDHGRRHGRARRPAAVRGARARLPGDERLRGHRGRRRDHRPRVRRGRQLAVRLRAGVGPRGSCSSGPAWTASPWTTTTPTPSTWASGRCR